VFEIVKGILLRMGGSETFLVAWCFLGAFLELLEVMKCMFHIVKGILFVLEVVKHF